jgi:hypothetical protein
LAIDAPVFLAFRFLGLFATIFVPPSRRGCIDACHHFRNERIELQKNFE